MNLITLVNAFANIIVIGAVLDVAFRVFGRPNHPIHKHKFALIARKTVSSIVICGALANLITLSTPGWTEVLINVGFAANYLFSCYYDRVAHSTNTKPSAKVFKQCSSRGTCSVGKTKSNTSTSRQRGNGTARKQNISSKSLR